MNFYVNFYPLSLSCGIIQEIDKFMFWNIIIIFYPLIYQNFDKYSLTNWSPLDYWSSTFAISPSIKLKISSPWFLYVIPNLLDNLFFAISKVFVFYMGLI